MIALDEIDDPELLRKHAQVLVGFSEYLQKRNKELADELARLKGLGQLPAAPASFVEVTSQVVATA